jgi:hypothetical protein
LKLLSSIVFFLLGLNFIYLAYKDSNLAVVASALFGACLVVVGICGIFPNYFWITKSKPISNKTTDK